MASRFAVRPVVPTQLSIPACLASPTSSFMYTPVVYGCTAVGSSCAYGWEYHGRETLGRVLYRTDNPHSRGGYLRHRPSSAQHQPADPLARGWRSRCAAASTNSASQARVKRSHAYMTLYLTRTNEHPSSTSSPIGLHNSPSSTS